LIVEREAASPLPPTNDEERSFYMSRRPLTSNAFKEWATVIRALERGRQTLLLRKGGLREDEDFKIRYRSFLLFPTYIHQDPDLLQPEWRAVVPETEAEEPPYNKARITGYAELADAFVLENPSAAWSLREHYVWNERYVQKRFDFQPEWPLYGMILRAYRLPEPFVLPFRTEYGGCRSWIQLERELPTEDAVPALSDEEFRERREEIWRLAGSPPADGVKRFGRVADLGHNNRWR
jgi:hypothetical protein